MSLTFTDLSLRLLSELLTDPNGSSYETKPFPRTDTNARIELLPETLEQEQVPNPQSTQEREHHNRRKTDAA